MFLPLFPVLLSHLLPLPSMPFTETKVMQLLSSRRHLPAFPAAQPKNLP